MRKSIRIVIIIVALVAVFTVIGLLSKPATPGLAAAFGFGLGAFIRYWFISLPVIAVGLFIWFKLGRRKGAEQ